jgi:hypothetical protein
VKKYKASKGWCLVKIVEGIFQHHTLTQSQTQKALRPAKQKINAKMAKTQVSLYLDYVPDMRKTLDFILTRNYDSLTTHIGK